MIDTSFFEDSVRNYSGSGQLNVDDTWTPCNFVAGQLKNGDIYLECLIDNHRPFPKFNENIVFEGKTSEGKDISISGHGIARNTHHSIGQGTNSTRILFDFSGNSHLKIGQFTSSQLKELRLAITNFEFIGTDFEEIEPNSVRRNTLNVTLDSIPITFRQVDNYETIIKQLRTGRGVDITCELILPITEGRELENLLELANILADLLTIAKSRKINWIYYDLYGKDSNIIFTEHNPRITSKFAGFEMIDKMPPQNIVDFLNTCFTEYKKQNSIYHFSNIANSFTDIHSNGFLETRCLALFSLIDYIVHKSSTAKELRQRLKETFTHFKAPISDNEISAYIKTRNNLVHEMQFVTNNPFSEYQQVVHLLDKLLLRILGYDGYYINIENLPHESGDQSDKLIPTP